MLLNLHIENYALIRSLDIRFDNGFTVITGETGAGKSILLEALALILGNRADNALLLDKSRKCFVEGEFDISKLSLNSFFEKYNLDYQDITILRREINEYGRSRAFINDTPVTLPVLKELAVRLVDIHSQHQNLLLNNAAFRINLLDQYAGTDHLLKEYQTLLNCYREIERELSALQQVQAEMEKERDYLDYVENEFRQANLTENEQEELEQQITTLSHAELISNNLFHINQLLTDGEPNILQLLKEVSKDCESIIPYDPRMEEIAKRLDEVKVNLEDIAYDVARKDADITAEPGQLDQLRERLDFIYFLEQKHHVRTFGELFGKWESVKEKLGQIVDNYSRIEELEKNKELIYGQTMDKALDISRLRASVIPSLEQEIRSKLQLLGMEDVVFIIDNKPGKVLTDKGIDHISFYFSANKGIPPEEIEKTASGGELSRLMLAIKSTITMASILPTIIFDEIDTGISGEIAGKVAGMMQEISRTRQLMAITHLPQIAAKGKLHYYVYKEYADHKTYTGIKPLDEEERIEELAKMMSGVKVTSSARQTAKELMD